MEISHQKSLLGEAIASDILPTPTYVTAVYSYAKEIEQYQKCVNKMKENRLKETSQRILDELRRALDKADGLDEIFDKHITNKNAKLIIFCTDYAHIQDMRKKAKEWFVKINRAHIYSCFIANRLKMM